MEIKLGKNEVLTIVLDEHFYDIRESEGKLKVSEY